MTGYVPIACIEHERLEFAVLKRRQLFLVWQGDAGREEAEALPLDVYTREGAEWLRLRLAGGSEVTLRLDRILEFREI